MTIIDLYRSVLRNEGVLGLWVGNGTNLLRVFPAKAVVFGSQDYYRDLLGRVGGGEGGGGEGRGGQKRSSSSSSSASVSFLSGGMAGITASAVTYPLDLARGRIAGKLKSAPLAPTGTTTAGTAAAIPKRHYAGLADALTGTVRDEGWRALYRGISPTLLGAVPYEGIKFGTVGLLESIFPPLADDDEEEGSDGVRGGKSSSSKSSSIWRKVCFGGAGGIAAGLLTYPNDTVRRFLQLQGSRGTEAVYEGYW